MILFSKTALLSDLASLYIYSLIYKLELMFTFD